MKRFERKKKLQAGHADDWLMTYADLITLLLCFFVLIVIAEIPKKKAELQPKPVVAPAPVIQPQATVTLEEAQRQHAEDLASEDQALDIAAQAMQQMADAVDLAAQFATIAEAAKEPVAPSPAPVPTGDRIKIFDMNSAAFFESGSAMLSEQGKVILKKLASEMSSDNLKDYAITVEGHTDDTPIHTAQFPSNWELSTARASAVVHYFLDLGIPAPRLRAAGYADTFPKVPNRDANGIPIPANRAENRRVVIRLEKIEKN